MVDKRWLTSVRNCRSYQGADIDSDHSLVLCKLVIRFRTVNKKKNMARLPDLESLEDKDTRETFRRKLESELNSYPLRDTTNIEERSDRIYGAIRTAVDTCIPKLRRPKNVYISQET